MKKMFRVDKHCIARSGGHGVRNVSLGALSLLSSRPSPLPVHALVTSQAHVT